MDSKSNQSQKVAKTVEVIEELKEPELDLDNYTRRSNIVSLIRDLKEQDSSGQQKPIRECIKPYFGVRYTEAGDDNTAKVTLDGQSVYLAPEFSQRKKRDELGESSFMFNNSLMEKSLLEKSALIEGAQTIN